MGRFGTKCNAAFMRQEAAEKEIWLLQRRVLTFGLEFVVKERAVQPVANGIFWFIEIPWALLAYAVIPLRGPSRGKCASLLSQHCGRDLSILPELVRALHWDGSPA